MCILSSQQALLFLLRSKFVSRLLFLFRIGLTLIANRALSFRFDFLIRSRVLFQIRSYCDLVLFEFQTWFTIFLWVCIPPQEKLNIQKHNFFNQTKFVILKQISGTKILKKYHLVISESFHGHLRSHWSLPRIFHNFEFSVSFDLEENPVVSPDSWSFIRWSLHRFASHLRYWVRDFVVLSHFKNNQIASHEACKNERQPINRF